ncbi:GNAT family N-acetyltransferase [Facklamia sp. DSM 111018]|uniref:GNAT family N-acetyltransferase n=1 Tax=Facklamia lactis TaxID=2749967 RepID=A0ABS0LPY4_9LACT|nr:GNAT family N-acetyltransferase [Facklamia lactis]MBG9986218.1 GNAT family N-acetyltransferase [Facklamia lactis]
MNITFRKCNESDLNFILRLKEKCFKWYIEKIYDWELNKQIQLTQDEMNKNLDDMNIIIGDGEDIGLITYWFDETGDMCLGMYAIMPEFQSKGIGSQILKELITKYKNERIYLKTYRENRAIIFYKRLGFEKYDETATHWLMEKLPEL